MPRLRRFEQFNAAAFERLKVDWEEDPAAMAKCVDADMRLWEIYDKQLSLWVSVYLLANVCQCGSDAHICHHIRLARHCAACGNNPVNAKHSTAGQSHQQAVTCFY